MKTLEIISLEQKIFKVNNKSKVLDLYKFNSLGLILNFFKFDI